MLIDIYLGLILKLGQVAYDEAWLISYPAMADEIMIATQANYNVCKKVPSRCAEAYADQLELSKQYNDYIKNNSLSI